MQGNDPKRPEERAAQAWWPATPMNGNPPSPRGPWPARAGAGMLGCCRVPPEAAPSFPCLPWSAGAGWPLGSLPLSSEVAKQVELELLGAQLRYLDQLQEALRSRIRELGGHDPSSIAGLP
jgi:hypothetical protein